MPRCGIEVHVTKRLPDDQVTSVNNVPVTSVERTLMDLCDRLSARRAAIALDNALSRGLTGVGELDYLLFRTARQGRNGCGQLRELLKKRIDLGRYATTPLETVIFELIAESPLNMPLMQQEIYDQAGHFVARPDFLYPAEKLIIEGHSRLWHEGVEARGSDRRRHRRLEGLGHKLMYVTWADATTYADRTLARIGAELEARRGLSRVPERPTGAFS